MIRINQAEAIIDEFWDPVISQIDRYRIESPGLRNLSFNQRWCWCEGEWQGADERRIGTLSRRLDLDINGYQSLVVCTSLPSYARIKIVLRTHGEKSIQVAEYAGQNTIAEYGCEIKDCEKIESISLDFSSESQNAGSLLLLWIGLSKARVHDASKPPAMVRKPWSQKFFSRYLDQSPGMAALEPQFEFIITKEKLPDLQRTIRSERFQAIYQSLYEQSEKYLTYDPEHFLNDTVYLAGRAPNFARTRERTVEDLRNICLTLSFIGLVTNDLEKARRACEMALTLASCREWRESFMAAYPFSQWRHAAFTEALCAETVCLVLDWSGGLLNRQGRKFLIESIYDKAIHQIERQFYQSDYYWYVNPAMVFLIPLLMSSIQVSELWPLYRKRVQAVYRQFKAIVQQAIFQDGGCRVSPGYWNKKAVPPVYGYLVIDGYIRNRGHRLYRNLVKIGEDLSPALTRAICRIFGRALKFLSIKYYEYRLFPGYRRLLSIFKRYPAYLTAVLSSAHRTPELLSVGDATTSSVLSEGAFLMVRVATGKKKRFWSNLSNRFLVSGAACLPLMTTIQALLAANDLELRSADHRLEKSVALKESCFFSNRRKIDNSESKFLFIGLPKNADHRHHDAGTFILEIDGEEFFIDRGSLDYSHPLGNLMKRAAYHNALTPVDPSGQWPTQNIDAESAVTIKSVYRDAVRFRCRACLERFWKLYFKAYKREIESDYPESYVVRDRVTARHPMALACHLHTPLECRIESREIRVQGQRTTVRVIPSDPYIAIRCETDLYDHRHREINHIVLVSETRKTHDLTVTLEISHQSNTP